MRAARSCCSRSPAVSGLLGLLFSEPCCADIMVAAVGFVPFSEGHFECVGGLTADPVLNQMRPLAEASQQVAHGDLPSHGLLQCIRGDAVPE